jgi:hypothetical protein
MKKCVLCKTEKDLSEFNRRLASKDGLQNVCRECNRLRSRRYYTENREHHKKVIGANKAKYMAQIYEKLGAYYDSHPCVDCGCTDIRLLEADHVGVKTANISTMISNNFSWASISKELEQCEIRCKNCHALVTLERLGVSSWRTRHYQASLV